MLRALAPALLAALLPACTGDAAPPPVPDAPSSDAAPDTLADPGSPGRAGGVLSADGGAVALDSSTVARLVAEDPLWADALRLHYSAIVVDGHVDTPSAMVDGYRIGRRHRPRAGGRHVDLPRMVEGGLDAPFFALYVSRTYGEGAAATARAFAMLDAVERQVGELAAGSPGQAGAAIARSAADVRRLRAEGRRAILLGLEGGHALAGDPEVLRRLAARGVRYVTLTHTNANRLADSSQDRPRHGGLSELGRAMLAEMNRLGVLPDVSHASDATVAAVVAASRGPVIASHSSCRALVDNVRNLTDGQMRAIAATGGVVMVNAHPPVVNGALTPDVMAAAYARVEQQHGGDLARLWTAVEAEQRARGLPGPSLDDYLDHVEHALAVVGPDHVGLGTDMDGVPGLPAGLEDVTRLPWITHGLLARGVPEATVRRVLGANALRALAEAERLAADG